MSEIAFVPAATRVLEHARSSLRAAQAVLPKHELDKGIRAGWELAPGSAATGTVGRVDRLATAYAATSDALSAVRELEAAVTQYASDAHLSEMLHQAADGLARSEFTLRDHVEVLAAGSGGKGDQYVVARALANVRKDLGEQDKGLATIAKSLPTVRPMQLQAAVATADGSVPAVLQPVDATAVGAELRKLVDFASHLHAPLDGVPRLEGGRNVSDMRATIHAVKSAVDAGHAGTHSEAVRSVVKEFDAALASETGHGFLETRDKLKKALVRTAVLLERLPARAKREARAPGRIEALLDIAGHPGPVTSASRAQLEEAIRTQLVVASDAADTVRGLALHRLIGGHLLGFGDKPAAAEAMNATLEALTGARITAHMAGLDDVGSALAKIESESEYLVDRMEQAIRGRLWWRHLVSAGDMAKFGATASARASLERDAVVVAESVDDRARMLADAFRSLDAGVPTKMLRAEGQP